MEPQSAIAHGACGGQIMVRAGEICSAFGAEGVVMLRALYWMKLHPTEITVIFTDSLSALQVLSQSSTTSKLCINTRSSLDELARSCSTLTIHWIRAHVGIHFLSATTCFAVKIVSLVFTAY